MGGLAPDTNGLEQVKKVLPQRSAIGFVFKAVGQALSALLWSLVPNDSL